jgi:hypothetical protein
MDKFLFKKIYYLEKAYERSPLNIVTFLFASLSSKKIFVEIYFQQKLDNLHDILRLGTKIKEN